MENPETPEEKAPAPLPVVEKPPVRSKPNRFQNFLRVALFSLAGALILFLAGALTAWFVFARPAQDRMRQVIAGLEEEKTASQERIDGLTMDVESLSSLETRNRELEQELGGTRLEIAILNTLTEVLTARIELTEKNTAGVRLALNGVTKSLAALEGVVQADQKEAVKAMQERLKLVMGEFETNAPTAEADLDILIENLRQLRSSNLEN